MKCHDNCAACCIALSISSSIPGMPGGKKAGERCIQLNDDNKCSLYTMPSRPNVCGAFEPTPDFCATDELQAMELLSQLETVTLLS